MKLSYFLYYQVKISEIMSKLNGFWKPVLNNIRIYTTDFELLREENPQMDGVLIYPFCKIIDLQDMFDLRKNTPLNVYFYIKIKIKIDLISSAINIKYKIRW